MCVVWINVAITETKNIPLPTNGQDSYNKRRQDWESKNKLVDATNTHKYMCMMQE